MKPPNEIYFYILTRPKVIRHTTVAFQMMIALSGAYTLGTELSCQWALENVNFKSEVLFVNEQGVDVVSLRLIRPNSGSPEGTIDFAIDGTFLYLYDMNMKNPRLGTSRYMLEYLIQNYPHVKSIGATLAGDNLSAFVKAIGASDDDRLLSTPLGKILRRIGFSHVKFIRSTKDAGRLRPLIEIQMEQQ